MKIVKRGGAVNGVRGHAAPLAADRAGWRSPWDASLSCGLANPLQADLGSPPISARTLPGRSCVWGRNPLDPAAVAGSAARRLLLAEVPAEKHASAFRGPGIVGNQTQAALAFVGKGLEFRHEIAHTGLEFLGRHDNADAAFAVLLGEARFIEIGQQHLAYPSRYASRVCKGLGRRGAFLHPPCGECAFEPLQVPSAWPTERLKPLLDLEIGRVEQEDAVCRMPVASGAPNLLNVLLQRAGSLVMQDVANVRLVDAHAESACRDHDEASRRLHEPTLRGSAVGGTHLAVIARDRNARAPERSGDLIDRYGRGAIDDARPAQPLDAPRGGAELLSAGHDVDGQAKVLAMCRSDEHQRVAQTEPFGDVLADSWRRRRREGKSRRV